MLAGDVESAPCGQRPASEFSCLLVRIVARLQEVRGHERLVFFDE
jgi:hypothetical protein